jgi:hypothetical protein
MVVVNGKFDGRQIILDKLPQGIAADTPVRVVFVEQGHSVALEAIASLAMKTDLPPDFAAQHHHYSKGLPKR